VKLFSDSCDNRDSCYICDSSVMTVVTFEVAEIVKKGILCSDKRDMQVLTCLTVASW
jgi:hypothetical protein